MMFSTVDVFLRDVPEDDIKAMVVKGTDIPSMTESDWKVGFLEKLSF